MNPFDSTSKKKPKEMIERINQANYDVNELIENAKECLEDPKFKQFRSGYEKSFENLVQIMLDFPRTTDAEFSAQMDSIRIKITLLQGFGFRISDAATTIKRPMVPNTTEGL